MFRRSNNQDEDKKPRRRLILKTTVLGLSGVLCVIFTICYARQPDSCAAITFWPPWIWFVAGFTLTSLGISRRRIKLFLFIVILWFAFLFIFAEEPGSLIRRPSFSISKFKKARHDGKALRIVSLNCAGGSMIAAKEVGVYSPDVVLLQESPGEKDVRSVAKQLFGNSAGVTCGLDTSIIARGEVFPYRPFQNAATFFTGARIKLNSGLELNVASIRYIPPEFRGDIWSSRCRNACRSNRQIRKQQVLLTVRQIERMDREFPIVVGGDFNARGGDSAFRPLRACLYDTFYEAGCGWGNTVLNSLPVSRYDQIWADVKLRPVSVRSKRTQYSDHRIVICDLVLR